MVWALFVLVGGMMPEGLGVGLGLGRHVSTQGWLLLIVPFWLYHQIQ